MSQLHILGGTYGPTLDARGYEIGENNLADPNNIFRKESGYEAELRRITAAYVETALDFPNVPTAIGFNLWRARTLVSEDHYKDLCDLHRRIQRQEIGEVRSKRLSVGDTVCRNGLDTSIPAYFSYGPLSKDAYDPQVDGDHRAWIDFQKLRLTIAALSGERAVFETIGSFDEAQTICRAAGELASRLELVPDYSISFVLQQNGTLIDGTLLHDAIKRLDDFSTKGLQFLPTGYGVNCCSVKSIRKAFEASGSDVATALKRIGLVFPNAAGDLCDELHALEAHAPAGHLVRDDANERTAEYLADLGTRVIGADAGFKGIGFCCGGLPRDNRLLASAINSRL